ncbi:glycosyltransferase family 2 protein [Salegentibacter mishustinae]|uniref:Glycosyltransferase 2-like domain-containing protein n=1 Tax=Salegentibacter mishustinae TaxID=270918 RepID=A0A0Q9Z649_9FLAO|nr:glycosyltransferase family 2 protein [Salegentibacter mishustinae]KRG28429.1 hypothetical protein APR42_06520 [Salegentibacter mishustinae]PNW22364.1 hypothetical protein APB85_14285 [Salegentibacter mishustinae]PZX67594.1 hypothetical protein LY54_00330 [Salegentibacter mishustinae]GGW78690.1 glycosyl transferase [Salegentibacter mishustinae]
MPQVSFIIVNYKTVDLVAKAVKSIYKHVKENSFEIILIDNSFQQEEFNFLLKKFRSIRYYEMAENLGFGKANNLGFNKAKGEYVFLLNSDAFLIDSKTITDFLSFLKRNEQVACVGGNLVNDNGRPNISYGNYLSVKKMLHDFGIRKTSRNYYYKHLATSKVCDLKKPTAVDYVSGAAIMIKSEVIKKFGLFDPRYFMYFEDMDLGYRYKKNGYQSVIIPNIKIGHLGGESTSQLNKNSSFQKQISDSKFLFLENVTNSLTVGFFRIYGSIYPRIKAIKKLFRSVNF